MARRPLHLRWIYVKDHALMFAALTASLTGATIVVVVLAEDPARGLLLGAVPMVFALAVWMLTNHAGYPNRDPETLAHERPQEPPTDTFVDEGPVWDPFERERRTIVEPTPESAEEAPVDGDPFASVTPAKTTAPEVPVRKANPAPIAEETAPLSSPAEAAKQSAGARKRGSEKGRGDPNAAA